MSGNKHDSYIEEAPPMRADNHPWANLESFPLQWTVVDKTNIEKRQNVSVSTGHDVLLS
jgi:hypothetical protein